MNNMKSLQAGVTLFEVLIAIVITAIGLLGMVALQTRAYAIESESYERSQATILLADMENRLRANSANAAAYVADDIGVGAAVVCTAGTPVAEKDLCEWGNLLRGAAESRNGLSVGAMTAARACITNPSTNRYVIAVVWQGTVTTRAPASACGVGAYSDEKLRRSISTVVQVATL